MTSDVRERFTVEDQATTTGGSGQIATITPLYREAATPPNITPHIRAPYTAAPPPVTIPYGWRMIETPDGYLLQHDRTEWNVICRAVEGKRSGRPYHEIAAELHAEGAPVWNERNREYDAAPRWHAERVRRLVGRYAPELHETRKAGRKGGRSVNRCSDIDTDEGFERMLHAAAVEMGEIPAQ